MECGATQPTHLRAQPFGRQWLLLRLLEWHEGFDLHDVANLVADDQGKRPAYPAMRLEIEWALELRMLGLKGSAPAAIEVGIVGLPNFVAALNAAEVNVTSAK